MGRLYAYPGLTSRVNGVSRRLRGVQGPLFAQLLSWHVCTSAGQTPSLVQSTKPINCVEKVSGLGGSICSHFQFSTLCSGF